MSDSTSGPPADEDDESSNVIDATDAFSSAPPQDMGGEPSVPKPPVDDRLAAVAENLRAMHERHEVPLPEEAIAVAPKLNLKLPPDDLAKKIADILCVPDGRWGLFRSGSELVVIDQLDGVQQVMTPDEFMTWLPMERGVFPVKGWRDKELADGSKIKEPIKGGLTDKQARVTLKSGVLRKGLPVLRAVHAVRLPVIDFVDSDPYDRERAPMRLLQPGFDQRTGIFTCKGGLEYDTGMKFDDAANYFWGLFQYFGWRSPDRDFAIHLATIIAMYGRGIYQGKAPATWYNANIQESGKTTLATYVTWLVHGSMHTRTLLQDAEEKLQDTLDTVARAGAPYVLFDNVNWGTHPVETVLLDEWLTNAEHAFRLKGGHTDVNVKLRCMTLGTGNGITLSTDLQRRSLMVDILNRVSGAERELPKDVVLLDSAFFANEENRRKGLAACWALVRAWDEAGRPSRPGRLLGSFEQWTKVIPSIVWYAGHECAGKNWDCMADSTNEDIGDKESKEFKRLAELALAEYGLDATTKVMRETFEIGVAQLAGVARHNAVATRALWPHADVLSVIQTENSKEGWRFEPMSTGHKPASLLEAENAAADAFAGVRGDDDDEIAAMEERTEGNPKTREYSASEWLNPKTRSSFGNACKSRFHERYFTGPDGLQYEFMHRARISPARYAITRVKR